MRKVKLLALAFLLSGCSLNNESDNQAGAKIDAQLKDAESIVANKSYTQSTTPRFAVNKKPVSVEKRLQDTLRKKTVRYQKAGDSVPLSAILESLNAQGVNITSQISLDRYRYSGFSINDTDAVTALEILTGTLGLDFSVEQMSNGQPLVYINALMAETRRLNIGPRNVRTKMGSEKGQSGSGSGGSNQQGQGGIQLSTSSIGNQATAEISSVVDDNFWERLKEELEGRLSRPVPKGAGVDGASQGSEMYDLVKLGHVVVNASTGAVTVMAPRTIRKELMDYMDAIDTEVNSSIVLKGQMILVNNTSESAEGIDWGGIRNTGEGVIAIGNDVLGNVSISAPGEFADVVAQGALAPSLLGYQRADRLLRVVNGYLQRDGRTKTVQMPITQTTSGVPTNINMVDNEFQILVSTDQATSEGGTTNTGAKNNILTFQYGTSLTLTPRVDVERGIIRTDVSLQLKIKQGTGEYNQLIAAGNKAELSPIELPLIKDLGYQGQALLKPGEVVVMGGQLIELLEENDGGITGLKDTFMGGLFGNKKKKRQTMTYYLLLSAYTVPYGA